LTFPSLGAFDIIGVPPFLSAWRTTLDQYLALASAAWRFLFLPSSGDMNVIVNTLMDWLFLLFWSALLCTGTGG
jgi:hypothetical protein